MRYVDSVQYIKGFFTGETAELVRFGEEIVNNNVDETDARILRALSLDARKNINDIARECSTTSVIVKNRMKRIKKQGIIIAYRTTVDIKKLGMIHCKVFVYLRNISVDENVKLYDYVSRIPNAAYFIRNITPWDIELEFVTRNYEEYIKIINKLRKDFAYTIRNIETVIMKSDEWIFEHEGLLK